MRLIGGLCILLAGLAFGLLQAGRSKRRVVTLRQLVDGLHRLETEMAYGMRSLADALDATAADAHGAVRLWLAAVVRRLRAADGGFASAWDAALAAEGRQLDCAVADRSVLLHLGEVLGQSDIADQLRHLARAQQHFAQAADHARSEHQRLAQVWLRLSILGALTFILLLL